MIVNEIKVDFDYNIKEKINEADILIKPSEIPGTNETKLGTYAQVSNEIEEMSETSTINENEEDKANVVNTVTQETPTKRRRPQASAKINNPYKKSPKKMRTIKDTKDGNK